MLVGAGVALVAGAGVILAGAGAALEAGAGLMLAGAGAILIGEVPVSDLGIPGPGILSFTVNMVFITDIITDNLENV